MDDVERKRRDPAARMILTGAILLIVLALVVNLVSDAPWSSVASIAATLLGVVGLFWARRRDVLGRQA